MNRKMRDLVPLGASWTTGGLHCRENPYVGQQIGCQALRFPCCQPQTAHTGGHKPRRLCRCPRPRVGPVNQSFTFGVRPPAIGLGSVPEEIPGRHDPARPQAGLFSLSAPLGDAEPRLPCSRHDARPYGVASRSAARSPPAASGMLVCRTVALPVLLLHGGARFKRRRPGWDRRLPSPPT